MPATRCKDFNVKKSVVRLQLIQKLKNHIVLVFLVLWPEKVCIIIVNLDFKIMYRNSSVIKDFVIFVVSQS